MSNDGFERIGEASATTSAWFVHGILGQGKNWRSFAQRWRGTDGSRSAALVDLRNHGLHPAVPAPHDLASCANDLQALVNREGVPDMLVGHSFGGKVVLQWLHDHAPEDPPVTWVLDSPPGPGTIDGDDITAAPTVLRLLREAPVPAENRDPVRAYLTERGLPVPIVAWLLTSLRRSDDGAWRWLYNLDGIESMLRSYETTDLWPVVEERAPSVRIVRAGRGGRFTVTDEARAREIPGLALHVMPEASHWLQVDDPDGLLRLVESDAR